MAEFSKASGTTIEGRTLGGWPVVMNFLHLDSWVSGAIWSMLVFIEEAVETLFTESLDEALWTKWFRVLRNWAVISRQQRTL